MRGSQSHNTEQEDRPLHRGVNNNVSFINNNTNRNGRSHRKAKNDVNFKGAVGLLKVPQFYIFHT